MIRPFHQTAGRVTTTTNAPDSNSAYVDGIAYDKDGKLHISAAGAVAYHVGGGIPVTALGQVCTSTNAPDSVHGASGLAMTAADRVCIVSGGTVVADGSGGLPKTSTGAIATS